MAQQSSIDRLPEDIREIRTRDKVISLEEAVRKSTSLPAWILRLQDRGVIAEGKIADIVIFDPEKIQDHATFTSPLRYSTGIDYMLVGGELVIENGAITGKKPGEVIRHKKPEAEEQH